MVGMKLKFDGLGRDVKNPRPSKKLLKSLKEARDIEKNQKKYPTYYNVEDLISALENKSNKKW